MNKTLKAPVAPTAPAVAPAASSTTTEGLEPVTSAPLDTVAPPVEAPVPPVDSSSSADAPAVVAGPKAVNAKGFSLEDAKAYAKKDIPQIADEFVANLGNDQKMYGNVQSFQQVAYDVKDHRGEVIGSRTCLRIDH